MAVCVCVYVCVCVCVCVHCIYGYLWGGEKKEQNPQTEPSQDSNCIEHEKE